MPKPGDKTWQSILLDVLARRKAKNPAYSLRALARQLEVSPSFLSEVTNGRKGVSLDRAEIFRKKLGVTITPDGLVEAEAVDAVEAADAVKAIVEEPTIVTT